MPKFHLPPCLKLGLLFLFFSSSRFSLSKLTFTAKNCNYFGYPELELTLIYIYVLDTCFSLCWHEFGQKIQALNNILGWDFVSFELPKLCLYALGKNVNLSFCQDCLPNVIYFLLNLMLFNSLVSRTKFGVLTRIFAFFPFSRLNTS